MIFVSAILLIASFFTLNSCANFDSETLLAQLSLPQKVAQLCMVAAVSNEEKNQDIIERWQKWNPLYRLEKNYIESLIKNYGIGGVVFFGAHSSAQEQVELTEYFQSFSSIPLLIALDAENGLTQRLDRESVIRFPRNMTLGAIQDPQLMYQMGYEIGTQLKAIGVHMNFAPVIDINNNSLNPVIGSRSFGSDKERVARYGIALMLGLQDAGIIACAKHFPGHGDTITDSHEALPLISHDMHRLQEVELYPFMRMIKAGVKSIMLAHLEIPALEKELHKPSSLSYAVATDLLQNTLGFEGLIITDSLAMKGIADYAPPGELELQALLAGADILLCPVDIGKIIHRIEQAVHEGIITEEHIDKKVLKVLKAKQWAFADSKPAPSENLQEILQSQQAKALKKLLYSNAITLAQSSGSKMSLDTNSAVIAIRGKTITPFEKSIGHLSSHNSYSLSVKSTDQERNQLLARLPNAQRVIISIHEMNESASKNYGISAETFAFIKKLKELGKEICVVLFGSAYSAILVHDADMIIVAYEDDPDAQIAAAEVLCGLRKAEGKLPI